MKTLVFVLGFFLSLQCLYAQATFVLHPLVGPELEQEEIKNYRLDEEWKLDFPSWHSLSIQKNDKGNLQITSLTDTSLKPQDLNEKEIIRARALIEDKSADLLRKLDSLGLELQKKDSLSLVLGLENGLHPRVKVVKKDSMSLYLAEKGQSLVRLPLESINSISPIYPKDSDSIFEKIYLHGDRLLMSTTAIPLKKGEWYYQNIFLTGQRFRGGLTDQLSFTVGLELLTTIQAISGGGTPLLNAGLQYNYRVGKKVYLGIESQAMLGEENFLITHSNLMMTLGRADHNFTTKLSVFSYGESLSAEEVVAGISLAYNVRLSKYWALVSENYLYTEVEDPFFFNSSPDDFRRATLYNIYSLNARLLWKQNSLDVGLGLRHEIERLWQDLPRVNGNPFPVNNYFSEVTGALPFISYVRFFNR